MRRELLLWSWRYAIVASLALAGCEARNSQTGTSTLTTYEQSASAILVTNCGACHGPTRAEGGYRIDTYLGAVARRDDGTPRVSYGDPNSALLQAASGNRAGHSAISADQLAVLNDWVVRSRVTKASYTVHDPGWMNPGDASQFHGLVLRTGGSIYPSGGYPFEQCTGCHGSDLDGGAAVACTSCHRQGVTACNTCHGDSTATISAMEPWWSSPPRDLDGINVTTSLGVGAHRSHTVPRSTGGVIHAGFDCARCHQLDPANHYKNADQPNARPVNVMFAGTGGGTGTWDRNTATCTNGYCHAPAATDTAANHKPFQWTAVGVSSVVCGTCHGLPPSSHADDRCSACHQQAYSGGQLLAQTHANGVIELGKNGTGCNGCHGDASSSAPPTDVLGRSDDRLQTVGAHRAHLEARHRLRGPIACDECHVVPSALHSPGHIDHPPPAVVFPPSSGDLARRDGAQPFYNAANATCGSVYCHGGGIGLRDDTAPNLVKVPNWTAGISQAACGACHGIPSRTPSFGHSGIADGDLCRCVECHRATMDQSCGLNQNSSTHLNGRVDF